MVLFGILKNKKALKNSALMFFSCN